MLLAVYCRLPRFRLGDRGLLLAAAAAAAAAVPGGMLEDMVPRLSSNVSARCLEEKRSESDLHRTDRRTELKEEEEREKAKRS